MYKTLLEKINSKKADIGVIGLGYVGLPLAVELAKKGFSVTGLEVDSKKVESIKNKKSYIGDIQTKDIKELVEAKKLFATTNFKAISKLDVVIICVPTPLRKSKDPDVSYIVSATKEIKDNLQKGQLIILESTTYPGTTAELVLPMLESTGLKASKDFFLAFSPERIDPANKKFTIANTTKVVGGICYRPNPENKFVEIAFLAISSLEQVKGFGTRLMNKLKDHCKKDGYKYFLTYADNNAIGYFKKQGFHKNIKMPKEKYKEYIKDYDGGTLMEAEIDDKIDYSNISDIFKQQKDWIVKNSQKFLNYKRKHTYQEFEDELIKKGINIDSLINKDNNIINLNNEQNNDSKNNDDIEVTKELFECIPGVKEAGWTYEDYKQQCENEIKEENDNNFLTQCRNIINKLKNHDKSEPFRQPVSEKKAPGYYEMIKNPMDLKTLTTELENGKYKNKKMFVEDLKKIFNNARIYNKSNTHYFKDADFLEKYIEEDLKKLKDF